MEYIHQTYPGFTVDDISVRHEWKSNSSNWHNAWTTTKSEAHDRYDDMMRNFAEMVRGKENIYSYDYELGLYKLILRSCGKEV